MTEKFPGIPQPANDNFTKEGLEELEAQAQKESERIRGAKERFATDIEEFIHNNKEFFQEGFRGVFLQQIAAQVSSGTPRMKVEPNSLEAHVYDNLYYLFQSYLSGYATTAIVQNDLTLVRRLLAHADVADVTNVRRFPTPLSGPATEDPE